MASEHVFAGARATPISIAATAIFVATFANMQSAGATDWQVDLTRSMLGFVASAEQPNGDEAVPINGQFETWSADISFDPNAPEDASVDVSISLGSVSTDVTGARQQLLSSEWFDAANSPIARYQAAGFSALGESRYTANGVLQLKGIEHRVQITFTIELEGSSADVTGAGTVSRLDFGIGRGVGPGIASVDVAVMFHMTAQSDSH